MREIDEFKKRIVDHFMIKPGYFVTLPVLEQWLDLYEVKMHDAFRELINDKIIIIRKYEDVDHYGLDIRNKKSEIRNFIRQEPFIERAKLVKPESKYFEGYDEQFIRSTERAWPNRGSYYYCTKKEDSKHWKVIIVTKPNTRQIIINFGSLADPKSRISKRFF